MNQISNLIFQILLFSCLIKLITNQVNKNIRQLQHDFRYKAKGVNYRMDWFKPENMSDFAKFFLCVDVFQKQMNVTLTGGLFEVNTSNNELPNFEEKSLKIKNADILYPTVFKDVLLCPLNLMSFEKIDYMLGTEFYITESANEYCVYSLYPEYQPSETEPTLHITAEICGLFLNIRYDKMELEQEFEGHFITKGVDLLTWPYLDQIDNKEKFLLCLHVHEKLTQKSYYKIPYRSSNPNNELPTCNVVTNHFIFTTYKGQHPINFINTLYCPMHTIQFLTRIRITMPKSPKTIAPYYLAQSANPNCVYKMGINGMTFQHQMHNNLSHEVFIQGEICDIWGTVNQDIEQIQSTFLLSWNSRHRADIESGGEIFRMTSTNNQPQLCADVFRSVFNNTVYLYDNTALSRPKPKKIMLFVGDQNMTITALFCHLEKYQRSNVMPLAYSANLGCVYVMNVFEFDRPQMRKCRINFEVCNVYPPRHFLQIRKLYPDPIF